MSTETYKPGQKKPTPPPADSTRVFYETLLEQNPKSIMAAKWCVEYGVLEGKALDAAEKLLAKAGEKSR
jgi:hypothetical protein